MLTDQDIDKLTSVFATKKDVERIESKLDGLTESLQGMIIAVDKLVGSVSD